MRRRRLNAYHGSESWPGKDKVWRLELLGYDQYLVVAAEMLEVPAPGLRPGSTLAPAARAVLDDRLAVAGLDVFSPRRGITGDVIQDADLHI